MPPIKIENRSNSEVLDIFFEIEDTKDAILAFKPRITAVLQVDNDRERLRSVDPTTARLLSFELVIWAMPESFISLGGTEPVKIIRMFKV
jgi:hypothetical protein